MEVPVGYHGGVVSLWCRFFCPSVYAHEAHGSIGTVGLLVCRTLNLLQEHPYQALNLLISTAIVMDYSFECTLSLPYIYL